MKRLIYLCISLCCLFKITFGQDKVVMSNFLHWPEDYQTPLIGQFIDSISKNNEYNVAQNLTILTNVTRELFESNEPDNRLYGHLAMSSVDTQSHEQQYYHCKMTIQLLEEKKWPAIIRFSCYGQVANNFELLELHNQRLQMLIKAQEALKKVNTKTYFHWIDQYQNMGECWYEISNTDSSIYYYEKAATLAVQQGNTGINPPAPILNNLGYRLLTDGQIERSIEKFRKAIPHCLSQEFLTAIVDNLGLAHYQMGDIDSALYWHNRNLDIAREIGMTRRSVKTMLELSHIYLAINEPQPAGLYFDSARALFKTIPADSLWKGIGVKLLETGAIVNEATGNWQQAYTYRQQLWHKKEQEVTYKKIDLQQLKNQAQADWIHVLNDKLKLTELEKNQVQQLNRLRTSLFIGLILLLGMAVLCIIYLYKQRLDRLKRQEEKMKLKNELAQITLQKQYLVEHQMQKELELQKKDMHTLTYSLEYKKQLAATFASRLDAINVTDPKAYRQQIQKIKTTLLSEIEQQEESRRIEQNFDRLNTNFYEQLALKHPQLSKNEQTLCGFIRIGLSNKDISNLKNITAMSVKKAKHRIKQKMKLSADDNLFTYLNII